MYRNNLHGYYRDNFRRRVHPIKFRRYGKFYVRSTVSRYGSRKIISNRMCDRFSTDNIMRKIFLYSRHH